jgi:ubiquinone/menaquinone biosynthesis C-methylase UbiE
MGLYNFYAERVFPTLLERALRGRVMDELTRAALAQASGDVLEIGFGSARSLPHYPSGVDGLWAVEPSGGMSRRGQARVAASAFPVHLCSGVGEALPFPDGRFDTVVLVLTLCSVSDPLAVLHEAKRVMKPDGKLLVFEHVQSPEKRWQRWQDRLTPIQKIFGCGCHLNREVEALAQSAGFTWISASTKVIPEFPGKAELFPIFAGVAKIS